MAPIASRRIGGASRRSVAGTRDSPARDGRTASSPSWPSSGSRCTRRQRVATRSTPGVTRGRDSRSSGTGSCPSPGDGPHNVCTAWACATSSCVRFARRSLPCVRGRPWCQCASWRQPWRSCFAASSSGSRYGVCFSSEPRADSTSDLHPFRAFSGVRRTLGPVTASWSSRISRRLSGRGGNGRRGGRGSGCRRARRWKTGRAMERLL